MLYIVGAIVVFLIILIVIGKGDRSAQDHEASYDEEPYLTDSL